MLPSLGDIHIAKVFSLSCQEMWQFQKNAGITETLYARALVMLYASRYEAELHIKPSVECISKLFCSGLPQPLDE